MRWDAGIIKALTATELRMLLRDPRVLVAGLLLPLLAMPMLMFGSAHTVQKRQAKLEHGTYGYAVTGSKAAWAQEILARTNDLSLNAYEVPATNGLAALNAGEIQVLVSALSWEEVQQASTHTSAGIEPGTASVDPTNRAPQLKLSFRADREESSAALQRFERFLEKARLQFREETLETANLPAPAKALSIVRTDVATVEQKAGVAVGRGLTLVLLLFVLTGGAIVALDSLAGEKERGTLETLLVSGAQRQEIVAAKTFSIMAVGLVATLAQISSGLLFARLKFVSLPVDVFAALTPGKLAALIVVYLPMVAFAAVLLLILSGRARSYKEAQLGFFPVFLLCLAAALAPLFPALSLRSVVALVPISNTALSAREILAGNFDWPFLALAWLSTGTAALLTGRWAIRSLSEERLIIPASEEDGQSRVPARFGRHALTWFAVIWALLLVTSNYLQEADIRLQLAVNLVVFLLGGASLMMWYYRLPVRETLSLRLPHVSVWLAVLCGVPGGMLTATGLFQLASYVVPVPPEMIEAFSENVLPRGMSTASLLFFLAVLPGIIEEIAFRGVLLSGLKNRFKPTALVLVVGAVFALYHVALFRFAPTFLLGVLLAFVTLYSRSIFPAMLWHALSNGLALAAAKGGYPLTELDWQIYAAGTAALGVSLWIIWRNRVPTHLTPSDRE